jgi:PAS domain S-box-containing protein
MPRSDAPPIHDPQRLPETIPLVVLERLSEPALRDLLRLISAAADGRPAFLHLVARGDTRTLVEGDETGDVRFRVRELAAEGPLRGDAVAVHNDEEGALLMLPLSPARALGLVGVAGERGEVGKGLLPVLEPAAAVVRTQLATAWEAVVREQGEAVLRESETRFRSLVEGSRSVFVYAHDSEGIFQYLSPSVEEVLGRHPRDLVGRSFQILLTDAEEVERVESLTRRSMDVRDRAPSVYRACTRHSDGREVVIEVVETPVLEQGRVVGVQGFARDISDRVRAEEELRRQTAYLERLFEAAPEGIVLVDMDGRVARANEEFLALFGYTREEVVGADINALIVPERLRKEGDSLSGAVGRGERVKHETTRRRRDGSELRVSILGAPIELQGGQIGVFGIYRDVTEERTREEQLRRSERLASLGTLLGGAAHELNNPLTSLRSFVQLMQLDDRSAEDAEALQIMACEADRAAKIVSDLRVFAGEASREPAPGTRLDLNGVVHHVLRVRDYALRNADIVVSTELDESLPAVIADRSAMEQVLLNLVVNAEQALGSQPAGEHPRRLRIRTGVSTDGDRVHLTVIDSGPGMEPAQVQRIFDPFYTTKEPGEGTGLGLSLVHRIVTELGGDIRVRARPGSGASFLVRFPVAAGTELLARVADEPMTVADRPLNILVVDDEPAIRRSLSRYLSRRGHRVEEAASGEVALGQVEGTSGAYHALIVDLRMPRMGGEALLAALRTRDDGLADRVVFMTGDAASPETARFLERADRPVLLKPFELREAAETLEAVARS